MKHLFRGCLPKPIQLGRLHFELPFPPSIFIILILSSILLTYAGCANQQDTHLPGEDSSVLPSAIESPAAHAQLGDAYYQQGSFGKAIEQWETAAQQYELGSNRRGQFDVQLKLSEAYQRMGQYEKAEVSLRKAEKLAQAIDDQIQMASVYSQLGSLYLGVGQPDKAWKYLKEGLDTSQTIGKADLTANILNNVGNYYANQQNYPEANTAYAESVALARDAGDKTLAVIAMINWVQAAISIRQTELALSLLQKTFSELQAMEDSHFKASALINVGLAYQDLRRQMPQPVDQDQMLTGAKASLQTAAQVAESIGDTRADTYALGYLGHIYEDINQIQQALRYTLRALHAAQKIQMPEALFQWQWQEGRLLQDMGDIEGAIAAHRSAIYTLQEIRNEQTGCYDRFNSPIRHTVEQVSYDLVDLLLKWAAQSDDAAKHQEYLHEAREMVELRKVYELRNYFQDDCVDAARLTATKLEDASQTAVVIYPIFLRDRVEVLTSFPSGLKRFVVSVSAAEIAREAQKFRHLLEKRTTRQYLPHARRLYEWFIRPMENDLNAIAVDTLVIVPDGPLRTIPLAAFHSGDHFLIESFAIATTPGLDLTDPEPIAEKSPKVLMLALTQSAQGFPALPYVSDELQNISALYPSKLLLNEKFQVAEVETALRDQQYAILHIASHAQFESDAEKNFIVAYDGQVSVNDLRRYIGLLQFRDTPLELLTLSACATAAGDDKAALGLAGIAIKAGARSALASLWHINDYATSILIEKFYHRLKDPSGSKAKSLQYAQMSLLEDSRFKHPGYWAPFILINNWL